MNKTDKKKDRPFVFVRCMTFNHEAYIKDALNGFIIQQTTFPFVVAIINDASTDKTKSVINEFVENNCIHNPEIDLRIEEYGTVLDVTVKDNPHCIFHIVHLNENHYGKKSKLPYFAKYENAAKYVAICEGDDFWTDPLKLQKQVDFLESHPEYSMCFHKVEVISHDKNDENLYSHLQEKEYTASEIYEKWTVPTCSVIYNRHKFKLLRPKKCLFGDIVLFLSLANGGKLFCLDIIGGVYRRHQKGVSTQCNNEQYKALYHQYKEMEKLFPNVREISKRKQMDYLSCLIYDKNSVDTWKYRFRYMWMNKKLFFSSFLTTTILSYMIKPFIRKLCNH